jgi:putative ABC transport system permease protein
MSRWWHELLHTIRKLKRGSAERDLDDEIQAHLDLETQLNIDSGMSSQEARRRAARAFGNLALAKENIRTTWGLRSVEMVFQDVHYGLRTLRRNPGFALVAVLTLALVIGATTSIFSAVNAALLDDLPYKNPNSLVLLWGTNRSGSQRMQVSFTNLEEWRLQSRSFEEVVAFSGNESPILSGSGHPEQLSAMRVSDGYFDLMQGNPLMGRVFSAEEQQPGKDSVAVLSFGLWQRRFGKDPSTVGRTIQLDSKPYTVIGVMPPDFRSLPQSLVRAPNEIYMPLASEYNDAQRAWTWMRAIARLKPGVSLEQAQAELDVIAHEQELNHSATNAGHGVRVVRLQEDFVRNLKPILLTLQGAIVLVVLIACINLANLLLARFTTRGKEIAIRAALGAGRARLLRQMITESLMLSIAGGACGLVIAVWVISALGSAGNKVMPELSDMRLDMRVLVFTGGLSILTGLLFGLAPALHASAAKLGGALKEGRGAGAARAQNRLTAPLVIAEIALSLVLLAGAGLLIRSFMNLRGVNPGFDTRDTLAVKVGLPAAKYPPGSKQVAFYRELIERIQRLPGVQDAGAVSILPESGDFDHTPMEIEGRIYGPGEPLTPDLYRVTPGYFRTLSIPLIKGRPFSEADDSDHPPVSLINETTAQLLWPGEDPIGKRVWSGAGSTKRTIVGVVADVYQYGLDSEKTMQLYVPHAENAGGNMTVLIRCAVDPLSLVPAVRGELEAVDRDQPIAGINTMEGILSDSMASRRFSMNLLGIFAAIALGLAIIGIYGVLSYTVTQRSQEFGIRMALGARRSDVLRLVVGQGMLRVLAGIAGGLAGAAGLTRVMNTLLFGVRPVDLVTFLGVSLLLTLVALIACYIPARRATRTDPATVLRSE